MGSKAEDAAEGKAEGKEDKEEAKTERPMMIFSQPIGLEYLLDSVVNLADYETLRMMMMMKARERKMYRHLEKRGAARRLAAEERILKLRSASKRDLKEEYAAVCDRLQELT